MFDYQTYYTNTVDNLRYYCIDENLNLPSVTTILRSTKNYTNNYKGGIYCNGIYALRT